MTFEEFLKFYNENKDSEDMKAFVKGLSMSTVEQVQNFVNENKDAKAWVDSIKDKHTNKALETWKTNHLEGLIDTEIKKRFPEKSEKDIEIEKLKTQMEQMQQEKLKEKLTNKAMKIATEKSLPIELIEFFVGTDEEGTVKNITNFQDVFTNHLQEKINEKLKQGYIPPGGKKDDGIKNPWSKEHFNLTEQGKMLKENPELAQKFKKEINN